MDNAFKGANAVSFGIIILFQILAICSSILENLTTDQDSVIKL